jgi:hypothetical protein
MEVGRGVWIVNMIIDFTKALELSVTDNRSPITLAKHFTTLGFAVMEFLVLSLLIMAQSSQLTSITCCQGWPSNMFTPQ